MTYSGKRIRLLTAIMCGAGAALVLWLFDPAGSALFPPCPLRALTGWYCPGCGSLRAIHQLLHGNLRLAFALNPLAVMALPFLTYGTISHAFFLLRGRGLPSMFLPAAAIRALAVAIILFGILRNVPVYPLALLAPGGLVFR